METVVRDLLAGIPANKFYPPRLEPGQYLGRPRLIEGIEHSRLLLIEAQAGQGKSMLAAQVLEFSGCPFAWYQLGTEDADPVALLRALACCLLEALPSWTPPLIAKLLKSGDIATIDQRQFANILLRELDSALSGDFWIVLEDLHLLADAQTSLNFIDYLLATAPPRVRFICTSRIPIEPGEHARKYRRHARVLDNDALAMTEDEVGALYGEVLGISLLRRQARELQQVTEGWVMGLILGSHALRKAPEGDRFFISASGRIHGDLQSLVEYFQDEVFARLPLALQRSLAKLSYLESVPAELARQLAEVPDFEAVLGDLRRRNLFIRSLDEADALFGLHQLFRDFLQAVAKDLFADEERRQICRQIATYYFESGQWDEALSFFLAAGESSAARRLLPKVGMDLFSSQRLVSLQRLIERFPEDVAAEDGWCAFFAGALRTQTDPPASGPLLERARAAFCRDGEEAGELLTLVHLIHYHMGYDGRYADGACLLGRAEDLFQRHGERLDVAGRILTCQHLANGYNFFCGDSEKAETYSRMALDLSERHGLDNLQAGVRSVRGFLYLLCGEWNFCRQEIELSAPLLLQPQVGGINRLASHTLRINLLEMNGDREFFTLHELFLLDAVEDNLIAKSIVGPFLLVWKSQLALTEGRFAEACEFADNGLRSGNSALTAHLRSEFLQSKALALACLGSRQEAMAAAEQSQALREKSGGAFYLAWNDLMVGATYTHLGEWRAAESHLCRSIERAQSANSFYLLSAAYLQRAFCLLRQSGEQSALPDLRLGLELMREKGYAHLYGLVPASYRELLFLALRRGVVVDFARRLVRDRLGEALSDGGEAIPLLKVTTLGSLHLGLAGGLRLDEEELTQAQKHLLALLLTAPRLQLSQEEIMCSLWPDSAPEKARSSFDSLLLRLRKSLKEALAPHPVGNYLVFRKGILSLTNCRVDARDFSDLAKRGLRHMRKKEYWQAGHAFYGAINRFAGPFHGGIYGCDEARDYGEELLRDYLMACRHWARLLLSGGQGEEAVQILNQALSLDRTNDELVRSLYDLHNSQGQWGQAAEVLQRYRAALEREEFEAGEIEEIILAVSQPPI